jgi:hypothetical protein
MKKILFATLWLAACQPTLIAEFQDRPVVESYLYAGEPASVTISKLLPFRDDVRFSGESVDNLSLTIIDEVTGYACPLTPQGNGGVYRNDLFIPESGHAYQLQFMYDNVLVTAATQIAAQPENVLFSKKSITAGFGGGFGGGTPNTPIEITWDNPGGDYYIVTATCITPNPTPVYEGEGDDDAPAFPLSFQSEITQGASLQLSSQSFSYFGKYTVKVCRIQPEYVLFCQRINNSSEPLVELNANVVNGFGIFTGIGSVSVDIYVVSN